MSEDVPEKEIEFFYLKVPNGDVTYEFRCPQASPLGDVYNALGQMRSWCEEQAKAAEEKQAEPEAVIESKPIEE